jgi:hypothetical protein
MRKIILICASAFIALAGLFVQAGTGSAAERSGLPAVRENAGGTMREVTITIGGKAFQAEIEQNADTEQILSRLPMELSMSRLPGARLIYGGSFSPAQGEYRSDFRKGELALCHYNYFILFYDDKPRSYNSEFRPIGRITSDLENLASIADGGKMRLEAR